MLGELNQKEINHLLRTEQLGRIGCHAAGVTYIVPVSYVFDGTCIYALSGEGMKLCMMRENPRVCFEVEQVMQWYNWQSVIAWGTFEELHDAEAASRIPAVALTTHTAQQQAAVGVRVRAHAALAMRCEGSYLRRDRAFRREELIGPIAAHPIFERADVRPILRKAGQRYLMRAKGPFNRHTVNRPVHRMNICRQDAKLHPSLATGEE